MYCIILLLILLTVNDTNSSFLINEVETFKDTIAYGYRLESHSSCCMPFDKCAKRCTEINICVSFFHNDNTSQCQLHSKVLSDINTASTNNGWKYYSVSKDVMPRDCEEVHRTGEENNGVYRIYQNRSYSYDVYCDMKTLRGGWTLFQRRFDGSEDFFRGWNDYVNGFGNVSGEFWLGLDRMHDLTSTGKYELRIDMEDKVGVWKYATYSPITFTDGNTDYIMDYQTYAGNAGDSLTNRHKGRKFSTYDHDSSSNCPSKYFGGWWYSGCHDANLNGVYNNDTYAVGLEWYHWHGRHYSLNSTEMKIRII